MLLRNWYKVLTAVMYNDTSVTGKNKNGTVANFIGTTASSNIQTNIPLTMVGGKNLSSTSGAPNMGVVITRFGYDGGVVFGTGNTAPTFDDYTLSGELVSTISASASVVATPDNDGCTFVGTYTLTNTASSDITIKEVGLIYNSYTNNLFLLERTVLDAPVTIPAGGFGQVVYTIRMNYPT